MSEVLLVAWLIMLTAIIIRLLILVGTLADEIERLRNGL